MLSILKNRILLFTILICCMMACNNHSKESTNLNGKSQSGSETKKKTNIEKDWKPLPGEQKIDTWTILYEPPKGGKFNGKLLVSNKRLLYDARFDYSTKGLLEEFAFIKWGSEGFLEISKGDIIAVETQKSLLAKKCIITLKDSSRHTFNYGALNIDKCAAAIRSK